MLRPQAEAAPTVSVPVQGYWDRAIGAGSLWPACAGECVTPHQLPADLSGSPDHIAVELPAGHRAFDSNPLSASGSTKYSFFVSNLPPPAFRVGVVRTFREAKLSVLSCRSLWGCGEITLEGAVSQPGQTEFRLNPQL